MKDFELKRALVVVWGSVAAFGACSQPASAPSGQGGAPFISSGGSANAGGAGSGATSSSGGASASGNAGNPSGGAASGGGGGALGGSPMIPGAAGNGPFGPAPDFGPNVLIFDPSTASDSIQAELDQVSGEQNGAQFGDGRYAYFFKPGDYTADVKVGFYTQALGLGKSPDDVRITG